MREGSICLAWLSPQPQEEPSLSHISSGLPLSSLTSMPTLLLPNSTPPPLACSTCWGCPSFLHFVTQVLEGGNVPTPLELTFYLGGQ